MDGPYVDQRTYPLLRPKRNFNRQLEKYIADCVSHVTPLQTPPREEQLLAIDHASAC